MNKTQLINQVCRQTNCSKYAATQIVNCCFSMIKKNAKAGSGVTIAGFGRFWCDGKNTTGTYRTGTARTYSSTKNSTAKGTKSGGKQVCFKPAPRW